MFKHFSVASLVALSFAVPAVADPGVGLGLNFTFGNGNVDVGAGLRVFSDDESDQAAVSLGVDYMFRSKRLRGSVGAAYLMDDSYIEVNYGSDFNGNFGPGFSAGGVSTAENAGGVAEVDDDFGCEAAEISGC